ncbi:MAG: 50S ribosomal protein L3 [Deltaproteobacteria bacterium]|nr:50S ribosomal protein L3 [Deltaproteobacteria bacterium]
MPGLIGEKLGMTQIFTPDGSWVPVTVLEAGPCTVVFKRTPEKEGYAAVQLGYREKPSVQVTRPYAGHFKKAGQKIFRYLQELKTMHLDFYKPGDVLSVGQFQVGDRIDVAGRSKGKGFQGVMKRHHFSGGMASHGCSVSHRSAGSIGQRTYPGKVFKGKRMAGQMGNKNVTMKNLTIVGIEADKNLLLVKGAVPGANHSMVTIYPKDESFEKRRQKEDAEPAKKNEAKEKK